MEVVYVTNDRAELHERRKIEAGFWCVVACMALLLVAVSIIRSFFSTCPDPLSRPIQIVDAVEGSYLVIEGESEGHQLVPIPPGSIREEITLAPDAWLIDVWVTRPAEPITWHHCERTTQLDFAGEEHDIFKITTYHTLI